MRNTPMENQANSSERPSKERRLFFLLDFAVSFYAEVISHPLKSGAFYFVAGFMPALFVGWILYPMVLYSEQPQPVNFSHAVHMDPERVDGIEGDTELEKCLSCHAFRDDGSFAGIPKLEKCMECHDDPESPLGESPGEQNFLTLYVADEKEIPWLIYSRQPDCVYFSHIAHVKMGDLECEICHGDHGKNDKLPIYKKNRLTGYSIDIWGRNIAGYKSNPWDRMKMDDCADCHTEADVEENNACFVCHK
jgi:hypothetical protein